MCSCTSAPSSGRACAASLRVRRSPMTLRPTGAPARSPRPTSGPHNAKAPPERKAQSVKRIDFSLQTSKVSASLLPPPSKVAATETVQPSIFGSLTVARALGANGFDNVVVLSPAVMTTPVAVFAVALMTVTEEGGPFRFGFGFGFGAAVSGVAAA